MRLKAVIAVYGLLVLGLTMIVMQTTAHSTKLSGPDLIVREDMLALQWVVREENLPPTACSVIEGEVTPGLRRLVRFTVMTPNVGDTDINLGDPNDHVAANDGLYEFASCHRHFHFRHYATYELIDPDTGKVWRAAKRGFCMLDTDPNPAYFGQAPREPQFRSCGAVGIPGNQGISAGWTDTYRFFLAGQYFVLDGGDGQPEVPPGDYIVRITVNPGFQPKKGESTAFASLDPATGLYHQLFESDYTNNVGQVLITIPDRLGKTGYGPLAGSNINTIESDEHDPPVK
ncbi:MAG TPA: lysyl oxidase family protein [Vicinamibacterales bacterium]|nr:lysyl oxidase family protein [Vicinamibacterales bacterium]